MDQNPDLDQDDNHIMSRVKCCFIQRNKPFSFKTDVDYNNENDCIKSLTSFFLKRKMMICC